MSLDPRRLLVLVAVAQAGGVLAAARRLHLTPSAVSQQVARLELEAGLVLLDRSRGVGRRGARLTPAGEVLARHGARIADVVASAEHAMAELTGQVSGPVAVGAFPTTIQHIVAPALAELARSRPDVRPTVTQTETGPGLQALQSGHLDVVVVGHESTVPLGAHGLVSVHLVDDPYVVVAPRTWGPVAGIEPLLTRPWVGSPERSGVGRVLDLVERRHGVRLARDHECLEFFAALALVAAGLAATVVPTLAVPDPLPESLRLVPGAALGSRSIAVLHRGGRQDPSPAARDAIAAMVTASQRIG